MSSRPRMRGRRLAAALLLGLLAAGAAASVDDYGQLPHLDELAISPEGTHLAFARTDGDERVVSVISLPDRQPLAAFKIGAERLRSLQWADENRLLILTSRLYAPIVTRKMSGFEAPHFSMGTPAAAGDKAGVGSTAMLASPVLSVGHPVTLRRDWMLLQVCNIGAHTSTAIPDAAKVANLTLMNVIYGPPMVRRIDGHSVIFVTGLYGADPGTGNNYDESNALLPALIRVDLDSGGETVVAQGSKNTRQWLTDAAGTLIAEQDYSEDTLGQQQRWAIKLLHGGRLEQIAAGREAVDYPKLLGLGPTGGILVQTVEGGERAWASLSPTGGFGPPLLAGRILHDPIESRTTHRLIGGVQIDDDARYVFFDPALQSQWDAVTRAFEGAHVRLESMTDDFKRLVVRVESPAYGYKYALVDNATHKAEAIGNVYAGGITPLPVRRITYAASDGLQIPAYLTLPRGRDATNLPLIVLPHRDAEGIDTADFDWWSQALADQGYAVLRPNGRGTALEQRFMAAGFGEWGRKMQTDLSDGVRYLAAQGIADPHRVCIVGARYGGYAALAGVSLDAGSYRCAVAVDGLSDLVRWRQWLFEQNSRRSSPEQRAWERFLGANVRDAALQGLSPIDHVAAISVPVLLIQGGDAADPGQSRLMYDALHRAGKPVQLEVLATEDELFATRESRTVMLRKSMEFLRINNPPD